MPNHPVPTGWFFCVGAVLRPESALRRLLTMLIAATVVVTSYGVIRGGLERAGAAVGEIVPLLPALVSGCISGLLVAIASASHRGLDVGSRLGIPALGRRRRAAVNAVMWGALAILGVRFSAPAFEPVPGGAHAVALLLGVGLAVGMYRLHLHTLEHDAYRTFNLVAMLLASGSIAAMSATGTGEWWTLNFSTLGTSDDLAAACFNVAIVGTGVGMALMCRQLSAALPHPRFGARRGGVATVRVLIVILGASLTGVGLVPIDTDTDLHNLFACGAAGAFAVLALGVQLWARRMPASLIVISYAFFAIEAAAMVLYDGVGLFNLTVFEVVAFSLVFAWLISLVACTAMDAEAPGDAAPAQLRRAPVVRHAVRARSVRRATTRAGARPAGRREAVSGSGRTSSWQRRPATAPPRRRGRSSAAVAGEDEPPDGAARPV